MYHVVKSHRNEYLMEDGFMSDSLADALHVDPATFRALQRNWSTDMRIVKVTTRADRAGLGDAQAAR